MNLVRNVVLGNNACYFVSLDSYRRNYFLLSVASLDDKSSMNFDISLILKFLSLLTSCHCNISASFCSLLMSLSFIIIFQSDMIILIILL